MEQGPTYTGELGPILAQRPSFKWSSTSGWSSRWEWKGHPQLVRSLVPELQKRFTQIEIEPASKAYDRIVATVPDAQDGTKNDVPLSNNWFLVGNDIEKSLWQHPDVVPILGAM